MYCFEEIFPKHLLEEALFAVMHVTNLSSITSLNIEVLEKIWFGKNVNYDNLCVFGCKTFVYAPNDERFKMNSKTRQCIYFYWLLSK